LTSKIDYSKLNDQVVKQAWTSARFVLDSAQRAQLIQEKLDRAKQYHTALAKIPVVY